MMRHVLGRDGDLQNSAGTYPVVLARYIHHRERISAADEHERFTTEMDLAMNQYRLYHDLTVAHSGKSDVHCTSVN
jgi:hypothetical protein